MSPEYSATLLLATPIVVPSSAITLPVSASLSTAPYAAGPGLPREPPSTSMRTARWVTADIRSLRSQARLGGAHQDPRTLLAADHLVAGRPLDDRELGGVDAELAAGAAALVQRGRADAALLRAELLVERHQVLGHALDRGRPLGGRLGELGVDLGLLLVTGGRQR